MTSLAMKNCSKRAHFNLIRLKRIQTRKSTHDCQFFKESVEREGSEGTGGLAYANEFATEAGRANKSLKNCHRHKTEGTRQWKLCSLQYTTPLHLILPYPTLPSPVCALLEQSWLCPVPTINVAISRNHESHANETAEGAAGEEEVGRASCRGAADEL